MPLSYVVAAATPTTITVAGTRVFLGTKVSDPTGDTFTEIGGVLTVPDFGPTSQEVKLDMVNQPVVREKGTEDYGTGTLTAALDLSDAGQIALKAAQADASGNYNLRLVFADGLSGKAVLTSVSHGTIKDIKIKVASAVEKRGGPNNSMILENNLFFNSAPSTIAKT